MARIDCLEVSEHLAPELMVDRIFCRILGEQRNVLLRATLRT